ncbi:hypothetical protein XH99_14885 [Bradyrhizobium nanningense]|uniref:Uncharacterized protein n=2 Tax=Nitrobacteraceae TaxID=41294 RepID=A0A4V1L273_9BRAD|nr:hypothetical protein XH99_14885 [Bradyrhizobium nanningense]RXH29100.1 hypothetical protein XH84_23910 [Bradyrhizobium nanningense]TQF33970.1 hypothetical protein UNPA324_33945 [Bradyrhizobium sp. UNPA324]
MSVKQDHSKRGYTTLLEEEPAMTLQDALAVYLYAWMRDKSLDADHERILDAAVRIIEQEAQKVLAAHSRSDE